MVDPQVFLLWFILEYEIDDIEKLYKMLNQALGEDNRWKRFHYLERALARLTEFELLDQNGNVTDAGRDLIDSDGTLNFLIKRPQVSTLMNMGS